MKAHSKPRVGIQKPELKIELTKTLTDMSSISKQPQTMKANSNWNDYRTMISPKFSVGNLCITTRNSQIINSSDQNDSTTLKRRRDQYKNLISRLNKR